MNKNNIGILLLVFAAGMLLSYYLFRKTVIEEVEVPVKIEVPVPVVEKQFDTVYKPVPVYRDRVEIDSSLYKEYAELKDSIAKDSLFKKAITINDYKETVEDDTIKIDLSLKVRGELLNYQLGYKTKPRNILLDTTITVPVPRSSNFYIGGTALLPTQNMEATKPSIVPELIWQSAKQKNLIKLGYDFMNKNVSVGYYIKL